MYTEEERAKWRERVARWRNGEQVYDAGRIVEKSDNTSVQKQEPIQPIKRDFIAEATRKHAAEAIGPDTRSQYQREQSQSAKQYANQQYQKAKDDAKRAEGMEQLMKTISPSTYVEAATGQDLGTAGRLITDAAAFGFPGAAKSIAGSTMQYGRKFLLSQMMRPLNKNMPSVAARFRNQEWSNFLSTTNGDNYYRIARNAKMLNPDEKYFFSHTTPWEEFSGLGSEFPSGAKRLYEFPTKTFGKLNATTHKGLETPESVVDMGTKHLLYGNTSSGLRGPVRVLSDKNAELLEMDPFINGTLERPRLPNGFYDKNPNYENIYLGNQTTIDGNTANQALQNATHTVYYPTQGGVQKELYLIPRKISTPTQISWEDAQKPLSAKQIFPNETGKGWLNATADRLGVNVNHYYNNVITPEELIKAVKSNGYESFISGKTFTEPAYIPSGFPYGLDKAKILMPYEEIRKMPMMAKYADLPEAEFRKIADDLIGSHEFIHWWNRQLAKNINSGRMKVPSGYQPHELTWIGDNLPAGIDEKALGKTLGYMSEMNGTESNARLGQIFNAFGIKKGQLQPQHLNLAQKFYRKVFPDNQMSIFLNAIKDKDALVKFANENAGTLFGTGATITTASNTNKYAE